MSPAPGAGRWSVALAAAVALAVAMGIGRFAFTPLLPMMLHDGLIDLHAASWLASANYFGYLAGALLCTFEPWLRERAPRLPPLRATAVIRAGLLATGLLTLGMALPAPALWPLLRFAAGVASAMVFVYTSGWCLTRLAQLHAGTLGGVMYTGPGAGIVVSGLFAGAMLQWEWRAATGWLIFGGLAFALAALVWRRIDSGSAPRPADAATGVAAARAPTPVAPAAAHGPAELGVLAFAYGLAGFGYIVTATFLPVIARQSLPGSPWLDLFWPIFGVGVVVGALLSSRLRAGDDWRGPLAAGYGVQAVGIAIGLASPSLPGFAVGSLLLGLPFTAITYFAMQEVRRLRPAAVASSMGLLTALYGLGQIVGPPLVGWMLRRSASVGEGFTLSLQIAMAALLVGAALHLGMRRVWPVPVLSPRRA